jgi:hypothetical protein
VEVGWHDVSDTPADAYERVLSAVGFTERVATTAAWSDGAVIGGVGHRVIEGKDWLP